MQAKLRRSLILHEQYRTHPYIDTAGKITIGIGYNLTDRGIDDNWINSQFVSDVDFFYHQFSTFSWFSDLNEDRQIVLIDMAFMGWKKFLEFEELIKALSIHDYKRAAVEMLASDWAHQVKGRAVKLAHAMITGNYEI